MKLPDLFPIRLHARDMGTWVDSPKLAKLMWEPLRGKTTWYATDCTIKDPDTAELFVYEMRDSFHGGIGDTIFSGVFPISKFGDEAVKIANEIILEQQTRIAQQELIRRESEERQRQVLAIRKELFGV
jgi:hypothetical protein